MTLIYSDPVDLHLVADNISMLSMSVKMVERVQCDYNKEKCIVTDDLVMDQLIIILYSISLYQCLPHVYISSAISHHQQYHSCPMYECNEIANIINNNIF